MRIIKIIITLLLILICVISGFTINAYTIKREYEDFVFDIAAEDGLSREDMVINLENTFNDDKFSAWSIEGSSREYVVYYQLNLGKGVYYSNYSYYSEKKLYSTTYEISYLGITLLSQKDLK